MTDLTATWAAWLTPSAGLPTVQWSLLLALAAAAGHLVHRYMALPKIVGYSAIGAMAGLAGFSGVAWPLQGPVLFFVELCVSIVLFETGGRIALRWFEVRPSVADALALVAMPSSSRKGAISTSKRSPSSATQK